MINTNRLPIQSYILGGLLYQPSKFKFYFVHVKFTFIVLTADENLCSSGALGWKVQVYSQDIYCLYFELTQ